MFKAKDLYLYNGLYLEQETFDKMGFKRVNGLNIISLFANYNDVYILTRDNISRIDKRGILDLVAGNNSERELCYIIMDDKLVFLPIAIFYGIYANDNNLVVYYANEKVRDFKLSTIKQEGINSIFNDINSIGQQIQECNTHKKLIKTYENLLNLNK